MGKTRITSIIVPTGAACPPGFTRGVSTRSGDRCIKKEIAPVAVSKADVDSIMAMFGNVRIDEVEDAQVDELMGTLQNMNMGGRRHTKKAGRRRSNKKTAGRRHHKSRK
jgi:hypothetical protein